MRENLIKTGIRALVFFFLLPKIPGITFHGSFWDAILMAIAFSIFMWCVEWALLLVAAYMAFATLGLSLLVLVPLWIFGFWIIPAIALFMAAAFLPSHLGVDGWLSAIEGGLVLLFIGMITGGWTKAKASVHKARRA